MRADTLPLVLPVMGTEGLPRGAHVRVRLGTIDDITLEVHRTVIERLDLPVDDVPPDAGEEDDGDDGLASPLALAIDVDEADTAEPGAVGTPSATGTAA